MMGGRIWVVSTPGAGTALHFTASFGLSAPVETRAGLSTPHHLSATRILVVDHNRTNRQILSDRLAGWGMLPSSVADRPRALELLEEAAEAHQPFVLLVTDGNPTGGFQLAEEIRRRPALAVRIIMMVPSGARPGETERCRALGLAGCLTKPVGEAELLTALMSAAAPDRPEAAAAQVPQPVAPDERRSLRILLAEDNVVNQFVAKRLLQKMGHQVVVSNNGREALERHGAERFDLVFMDLDMPEVDGFEATRAIREQEETTGAHTPIVALTAHTLKSDRERCLAAGMDDYVSKPVEPAALLEAIDRVVYRAGAQR